jgi:PAS domain S-box-containing protein
MDGQTGVDGEGASDLDDSSQESEARFRLICGATTDALWEWNLVTQALWLSSGFETLFGVSLNDLPKHPSDFVKLVHPDDAIRLAESMRDANRSGVSTTVVEYRLARPSGSFLWVSDTRVLERDSDGRLVRIVGAIRDVTSRRTADGVRRLQSGLLDEVADAIAVRNLNHEVLYWNRSAAALFGWPVWGEIGSSKRMLVGAEVAGAETALAEVLRSGAWIGELRHRRSDSQEFTLESRWMLGRDEMGRPTLIFTIASDVTERRRIERHFLRAQRMESIGTLAGGLAHDLNNVLAPIMMAVELLRSEEDDPHKQEVLALISDSTQRGAEMVSQVLSFARGVEVRRAFLLVDELFATLQRVLVDLFPRDIVISMTTNAPALWVAGDMTQLHQVLLNLCVNARDAMPGGGRLTVSADRVVIEAQYAAMQSGPDPGVYVVVDVVDTGVGMPPVVLERAFDPFFTTKPVGSGSGLGLPAAAAIVKGHGGFLQAYSDPGRGSKFRVYLPLSPPAGSVISPPAPTPAALRCGNGECVLVIDDEQTVLEITRQTLETFGYQVLTARDGAEGIALYSADDPVVDAVVTDLMMPVLGGEAVNAALLRLRPDARIIAVSGLEVDAYGERGSGLGARRFLAKPFTTETLLTTLREVLNS